MLNINRLLSILALAGLLGAAAIAPLGARTRKGEKLKAEGRVLEVRKDYDGALELYQQALAQDPSDPAYQLAVDRVRFQASQAHMNKGLKLRSQGSLTAALLEFQKAYVIDPSSGVAQQEIRRTQEMIEREKKKGAKPENPEDRGLTPFQEYEKKQQATLARILSLPQLKPLNPQPINLKMNNQPPRVLFETVGKLSGINVLFDPEYQPTIKPQSIELTNSTLDEALNYIALITKSFWKPVSPNAIFVTMDNTTKRRDYEDQVMKVFYLSNITTAQELQEVATAVRSVADVQRTFVDNAQSAVIVRGEADKVALAGKIIADLDKPKPEVLVDVIVMETKATNTRDLAFGLASGITSPITFTGGQSATPSSDTSGGTTTTTTTTGSAGIPLSRLGKLSTNDYSIVLPNGSLQALLSRADTRILQAPEVRSINGQKASLKIGERVPVATGSFQPGIGGVGINPLVNTQFTYLDVGVNIDITPFIHENGDVSMHVEADISNQSGQVNLGGIEQPIIGQRKVVHDIRMQEGQVNLLGGLMQVQETKSISGVPGLASIPIIKRLFSSESVEKDTSELLIALIPHIIRKPEITPENMRGIAAGTANVIRLNYAPQTPQPGAAAAPAVTAPSTTPPATAQPATAPPATAPPVTAPPATAPPATAPPATAPPATAPPVAAPKEPAPEAAAPSGSPAVGFTPVTVQTQVNGTFNVTLSASNVTDLAAAPLSIKFDPKVVRLTNIVRGDFLTNGGQQVIFTKNILNDMGIASVNLNRFPGTGGVNGSGALVTLSFQAVGRGTTTVTVPQLTLRNSQSQPILTTTPQLAVTVK